MRQIITASFVLATGAWVPSTLPAQDGSDSIVSSRNGLCRVWEMPPGASNFPEDASYGRCALDRRPRLRNPPVMPTPRIGTTADGLFLVVVNADGAVDRDLTRAYLVGADSEFHRRALEFIGRWRFEPGIRSARAVRSAFRLHLTSDRRYDIHPSRLEWRYVNGRDEDTLAGTWMLEPPVPPLAKEQVDSIYTALLRHLVRMQVVVPSATKPYCIVLLSDDLAEQARAIRLASRAVPALTTPGALAPAGCAGTPGTVRLSLPRLFRTEGGRVVLNPSGEYLANWPPGLDGRSWRFWKGRCVGELSERGRVAMFCDIAPEYTDDEMTALSTERKRPRTWPATEYTQGDSVRVAVLITTGGAYLTDTLRTVVNQLPRLQARAVRDSLLPCGGRAAYSLQDAIELYLIHGDLTSNSIDITRVTRGRPPVKPAGGLGCAPVSPARGEFAAFLLGDLGDQGQAPITLCFSQCATSYVLDPARHTLLERAQVTFRMGDLRPDTKMGKHLKIRILAQPAPTSLLPLVVVSTGAPRARFARRVGPSAWDYGVIDNRGYPPDTEVHIYLTLR